MRSYFPYLVSMLCISCASAAFGGRINLGTDPGNFFDDPAFAAGDTTFTRTVPVDGQDFDVTVEAVQGLYPNAQAVGVGDDTFIDVGDTITFTFNTVPANAFLSSVGMGAFANGTDTYDVELTPPGGAIAGTTFNTEVDLPLSAGSVATITGTGGEFRALWLSIAPVPEPSSIALAVCGLLFFLGRMRRP